MRAMVWIYGSRGSHILVESYIAPLDSGTPVCAVARKNPHCPALSKRERDAPGDVPLQIMCTHIIWFDLGKAASGSP